jgi:hypothetical protein
LTRALPLLALLALGACGPVKKDQPRAELDLYLDQFEAVRSEGSDIYLRVSAVSEERGGAKAEERRKAFEARLQALRLIDKYNRVLVGMARGEDPKTLKSGMKDVGSKLSSYQPSAQTTFAFAAAIPYIGAIVSGAGYVQEALAKRRFVQSVRAAQKPISSILDLLLLDSEPLETVLVEDVKKDQDAPRAAVDSLSGRFFKRLKAVRTTPDVEALLAAHNALREKAGLRPVPNQAPAEAPEPKSSDLEYLQMLTDQAAVNLQAYEREAARIAAEQALFVRYRAALTAAKASLAALNTDSEPERAAATGQFNEQALAVRQQAVKLREASR